MAWASITRRAPVIGVYLAWGTALVLLAVYGVVAIVQEHRPKLSTISSLGPVATAIAATVALLVGIVTVVQRARTDRRDQWWKRVQWGLDKAADPSEEVSAVGFAVLRTLLAEGASRADTALLVAASEYLNPLGPEPSGEDITIVVDTQYELDDTDDDDD